MKITQIVSTRRAFPLPFWHLVWEWEDVISERLNIPIEADTKPLHILKKNAIVQKLVGGTKFVFDMNPWHRLRTHGIFKVPANTIPYIIDFYLTDEYIEPFVRMYQNSPLIFISSRQVYEFLKSKGTGLDLRHLPLSLSDKYQLTDAVLKEKMYDVVLLGRLSPIFEQFLEQYLSAHPETTVVRKRIEHGGFNYYDNEGQFVGNADDREGYMSIMRKSRVMLYTTPGYDGEKKTNGFSQVTPRFLEAIACGCNPVMRYPDNADTRFFELDFFAPSAETYEQFESQMNKARKNVPDMNKYRSYLTQHYTSKRAEELNIILNEYEK